MQRICMLPSTPRSSASRVYSGAGPDTIVGAVMLSLNSSASAASAVRGAATATRRAPLPRRGGAGADDRHPDVQLAAADRHRFRGEREVAVVLHGQRVRARREEGHLEG